jgi:profilin
MAWQPYVDSSLLGTGKIVAGAILGHDGSIWAASPTLSALSAAETSTLLSAFKDPAKVRSEGFKLAGSKYITIVSNDREVYGKAGGGGVCCVKTGQTVVVGVYDEKTVSGEAAKIVGSLGDYLISVNY